MKRHQSFGRALVGLAAVIGVVTACRSSKEGTGEGDTSAAARRDTVPNRVRLSEQAALAAHIETRAAVPAPPSAAGELTIPGQATLDSTRIAIVSSRAPGRLERIGIAAGSQVREGDTVALLSSPQFLTAESDFAQATRRARFLSGSPDDEGATALANAARRRLLILGASETLIERLAQGAEPTLELALTAPRSGHVLAVHALPGVELQPGEPVATIVDLSTVNVIADIPEQAMGTVRVGTGAHVVFAAFPQREYVGRIARFRSALDPATRTGQAIITMTNDDDRLKPGMFGTVRLAVALPSARTPLAQTRVLVPQEALLTEGSTHVVFVEIAPRQYERRDVLVPQTTPGSTPSANVIIELGVRAGERVVTSGAFVLQSELKKAALRESED